MNTNNLRILIDNTDTEVGELENTGISLIYQLENPESFEQKQGSLALNISLPATPTNDRLFNSFHNPKVADMSGSNYYTDPRRCSIIVGGIEILRGVSMLQGASHNSMPGSYTVNCYGQNGDWSVEMKDISLWHVLSDTPHTFDLDTVENSWFNFDSDEAHDFVYAPVRYRQPFGPNDKAMHMYHMRPSLSIYWMIIRAFRLFGYRVSSEFMSSAYFRKLVMPWVWGDFYDLNGQIVEAITFKAAGLDRPYPSTTVDTSTEVYSGLATDPTRSRWTDKVSVSIDYVTNYTDATTPLTYHNFFINDTVPPVGFDNLSLYEFDSSTNTMRWRFNPPPVFSGPIGSNITANFDLNLIAKAVKSTSDQPLELFVEVKKIPLVGSPTTTDVLITSLSQTGAGIVTKGSTLMPTPFSFSVSGINWGDTLEFRLKYNRGAVPFSTNRIIIISSGYINSAPSGDPFYTPVRSTFQLSSLQVELGGQVNFKLYDKFRSYKFLDMLRGLIDMFNLSIQTNPIDKVVTIEPTHEYRLPAGLRSGYYKAERLDWTNKQDMSKDSEVTLFSDTERQLDFQFKQDGSDGGQNIYAARYKAIYLNNTVSSKVNNSNVDNGIVAGVPGAARYMFPLRFRKGVRQMTNRFFSATMHYNHAAWKNITGTGSPAPQLIAIIPDNINDSSASAITQTFEPKIAYYKGPNVPAISGGWRWLGDPRAPYPEVTATSFGLPEMFAVNYGPGGENDPVLSYSDQMINGLVVPGLVKCFFLKRLAIMRHGRQYRPWMRLDTGDMINWLHRERIIVDGAIYNLIGIDRYNPLSDNSAICTMWQDVPPAQTDIDNIYPSTGALNGNAMLGQFDMRYAPLKIFGTDLPQI